MAALSPRSKAAHESLRFGRFTGLLALLVNFSVKTIIGPESRPGNCGNAATGY
jgi:hypothetical protein